jgi:hypothetical protein
VGLRNCKAVPRTLDVWVGINRLRQILPRFSFRIPACERLLEGLSNYHTVRASTTGLALDEPVHDWSSHFGDSARVIAKRRQLECFTAQAQRRMCIGERSRFAPAFVGTHLTSSRASSTDSSGRQDVTCA